jgi:hypothetical protein
MVAIVRQYGCWPPSGKKFFAGLKHARMQDLKYSENRPGKSVGAKRSALRGALMRCCLRHADTEWLISR